MEIFEVGEHEEIGIPIERLIEDGELALDERIEMKGYLTVSLSAGRLKLKSTRFVGLIPLSRSAAVRVVPKMPVANLSRMIIRSGNVPTVIEDFSRGYRPLFAQSERALEIYYRSLLASVIRLLQRGMMKNHVTLTNPPKWRGRLRVSDTVNRYVARGIRYDASFDFQTLSHNILENRVIKSALYAVDAWLSPQRDRRQKPAKATTKELLAAFAGVSNPTEPVAHIVSAIPRLARNLPAHMRYYAEPLWTSYAILQGSIPDVSTHGYISLDSMVIDVSDVFEGYLREVLRDKTKGTDLQIIDGNQRGNQKPFFTGNAIFKVKPDIIVERRGEVLAILDSKYKPSVKEQDRYEMLAFLDATNAKNSAFICPRTDGAEPSHFLGTTRGGKRMGIIRFNMSSDDIPAEEEKLYQSMLKVVAGRYNL